MRTFEEIFLMSLGELSTDIKQVIDDHSSYYDKIHSHILMGEITKKMVEMFLANELDITIKIFSYIDNEYKKRNDDVCNLIVVSMLENLPSTSENGNEIKKLLSETLYKEYLQVNF